MELYDIRDAVMNGTLTAIDDLSILTEDVAADLRRGNAGFATSAIRLAEVLAPDWTWRIGYDGLARMEWRKDPGVVMQVISLNAGHALTGAVLSVLVLGPEGVAEAASGASGEHDVDWNQVPHKMGIDG